jgi:hypothetical protein
MKISGVNGKVLYGSVVVAEMVSWSMSGISQPTASAPTAFGDTGAKVKEVTELPDPGTIEFNGNYDPSDSGDKPLSVRQYFDVLAGVRQRVYYRHEGERSHSSPERFRDDLLLRRCVQ